MPFLAKKPPPEANLLLFINAANFNTIWAD